MQLLDPDKARRKAANWLWPHGFHYASSWNVFIVIPIPWLCPEERLALALLLVLSGYSCAKASDQTGIFQTDPQRQSNSKEFCFYRGCRKSSELFATDKPLPPDLFYRRGLRCTVLAIRRTHSTFHLEDVWRFSVFSKMILVRKEFQDASYLYWCWLCFCWWRRWYSIWPVGSCQNPLSIT